MAKLLAAHLIMPRVIAASARDLYLESVDTAIHERYYKSPDAVPDQTLFGSAMQSQVREVA